ncbi:MAG: DnaB-like helicase N-terminal domain-containing protein [bacterium]
MAKQKEIKLNSALPYDINAEKAFLGCVLLRPSLLDEVEVVVSPQDFFDEINKTVYTLILEMASENVTPDLVTLHSYILKRQLQGKINVEYIAGLSEFVAVPENIIEHAKIIKNNSMRRKIINFGMEAISIGNTYEKKVDEGCAQIQQKALDLDIAGDGDTLKSIQEIYKDWYVDVERNHDNSISFTGIDTGYHELNEITGVLQDTDLIYWQEGQVWARPLLHLILLPMFQLMFPRLFFLWKCRQTN